MSDNPSSEHSRAFVTRPAQHSKDQQFAMLGHRTPSLPKLGSLVYVSSVVDGNTNLDSKEAVLKILATVEELVKEEEETTPNVYLFEEEPTWLEFCDDGEQSHQYLKKLGPYQVMLFFLSLQCEAERVLQMDLI